MQSKREEIAARVRELREIREISVAELAEKIHVPAGDYEQMERGEIDFPASLLYEIAQQLHAELVMLLAGHEANMRGFCVTRAGQGLEVKRRADYGYQNLAANFHGKRCEPFIVTVPMGGGRPHSNAHNGQELNYVLAGAMKVYIHDQEITLNAGDSIYFDATQPHAMEAIGNDPTKFLAIIVEK